MKPAKAGWEMDEPALAGLGFIRHGFQSMAEINPTIIH